MHAQNWLAKSTAAGQAEFSEIMSRDLAAEYALHLGSEGHVDPPEVIASLKPWQCTATVKAVTKITPTGAAILPKAIIADADLPRLPSYQKVLAAIGRAYGGRDASFVRDLLRDIDFQHHQSTNGRLDPATGRYERWGVRPVAHWCAPAQKAHKAKPRVSKATFHRVKDWLLGHDLIVAEAHRWLGENALWIKPCERLSRILFEPGFWETIADQFAPAVAKAKPAPKEPKGKPRGRSAQVAAIRAEQEALYREAINGGLEKVAPKERWVIWNRLTKPTAMSANYELKAFAPKDSYRYRQLTWGLSLASG